MIEGHIFDQPSTHNNWPLYKAEVVERNRKRWQVIYGDNESSAGL